MEEASVPHEGGISGVKFLPDGHTLVSSGRDGMQGIDPCCAVAALMACNISPML